MLLLLRIVGQCKLLCVVLNSLIVQQVSVLQLLLSLFLSLAFAGVLEWLSRNLLVRVSDLMDYLTEERTVLFSSELDLARRGLLFQLEKSASHCFVKWLDRCVHVLQCLGFCELTATETLLVHCPRVDTSLRERCVSHYSIHFQAQLLFVNTLFPVHRVNCFLKLRVHVS